MKLLAPILFLVFVCLAAEGASVGGSSKALFKQAPGKKSTTSDCGNANDEKETLDNQLRTAVTENNPGDVFALEQAIKGKNIKGVELLNDIDEDGLLHIAAVKGLKDIVAWLLDAGVDIEMKGLNGRTALIVAAAAGQTDTVSLLLDRGANIKARTIWEGTALIYASGLDTVRLLLDRGAPMNDQDNIGRTALMMASMTGRLDTVRLLLDRGAAVNVKDINGWTALWWATHNNQPAVADFLRSRGGTL